MDASHPDRDDGKPVEQARDGRGLEPAATGDLRSLVFDLARLLARDLARLDHHRRDVNQSSMGD